LNYLVYKTTNLINGKTYIGCHKTKDLNDGYMGSGKVLKRAIEKYRPENFKVEHICLFGSAKEMFDMESLLVDEDFIKDPNTYNLKRGGEGGFDYINSKPELQGIGRQHMVFKEGQNVPGNIAWKLKFETDKVFREQHLEKSLKNLQSFKGKKHTDETRRKMSESSKGKGKGSANSQFGTMWITNGIDAKKIPKTDAIPRGFRRGRK
jgi:hypothetical protein